MTEKNYDYLEFGRGGRSDGGVLVDFIGFVSTKHIRTRAGGMKSFGVPLENVQRRIASIFPDDFDESSLPETNWINVAMFNNENFKLAEQFEKAIEGKERIRVRITGVAKVDEYNGNKSVSVIANNFHILWADTYQGTNVGGGEDGYSYVSGQRLDEKGKALMAIQGFVNNPETRVMPDGRSVLNFSIALNKAQSEVNYALQSNIDSEPIWANVAIFDNDYFPAAEQAAKVIRQGAAIAGFGFAKAEEYEGTERLAVTLNGFEMLRFAPREEDNGMQVDTVGVATDSTYNEDMEDYFDTSAEYDDDDLPF